MYICILYICIYICNVSNHFKPVEKRSSFTEQTTPVAFLFHDSNSVVANLSYIGRDLDLGELGGVAIWDPPGDVDVVLSYEVFFGQVWRYIQHDQFNH